MTNLHTRRDALLASLLAASGASAGAAFAADAAQPEPMAPQSPGLGDFDWLVGKWNVRHHRLKERLAGSHEWEDFAGTSQEWLMLGGYGTVDDNVIELPSGTYRAMGFRAFNPETRQWSVWWLDARRQTIDPPVREHLNGVAAMVFLPAPLRLLAGRFNLFATKGFLPPEFRAHMNMSWSSTQQRQFDLLLSALRIADRVIPRDVWLLGYRMYLWDMRARARRGKRVV